MRELGRRAGLTGAAVSAVIKGTQKPGFQFCIGIAKAFHISPESVLRRAGLLPPVPPAVAEEREAVVMLRQLPAESREAVLMQLRAMTDNLPLVSAAPRQHHNMISQAGPSLEEQLLHEFRQLPEEWQEAAIDEIEQLQRYSQMRVRIIGDEE